MGKTSEQRVSDDAHDLACDIMEGKLDGREDEVTAGAIIILAGCLQIGGKMTREDFIAAVDNYLGNFQQAEDFGN